MQATVTKHHDGLFIQLPKTLLAHINHEQNIPLDCQISADGVLTVRLPNCLPHCLPNQSTTTNKSSLSKDELEKRYQSILNGAGFLSKRIQHKTPLNMQQIDALILESVIDDYERSEQD